MLVHMVAALEAGCSPNVFQAAISVQQRGSVGVYLSGTTVVDFVPGSPAADCGMLKVPNMQRNIARSQYTLTEKAGMLRMSVLTLTQSWGTHCFYPPSLSRTEQTTKKSRLL